MDSIGNLDFSKTVKKVTHQFQVETLGFHPWKALVTHYMIYFAQSCDSNVTEAGQTVGGGAGNRGKIRWHLVMLNSCGVGVNGLPVKPPQVVSGEWLKVKKSRVFFF